MGTKGNTDKVFRSTKARRWCFTYNNPEIDSLEHWNMHFLKKYKQCIFVIGFEVAPNTGTQHWQGYLENPNPINFNSLKKYNNEIHWERAIADRNKNFDYCTKSGNYYISENWKFDDKSHYKNANEIKFWKELYNEFKKECENNLDFENILD